MKNSLILFTAILFLIVFPTCKKDSDTTQSNEPQFANTPTCAYYSYEAIGAGQYGQFITFFDLRSTTTAEKKFFKVQLKFQGVRDSFEVVTATQSINNIAPGFPSEITAYPGYGWVNQWTNPQYRLLSTGGGSYYKDTIPRNPQSNIYYLYQNFLGGALKGEWPQSNFDNYSVPTGVNGQNSFNSRTIFYFKKGFVSTIWFVPATRTYYLILYWSTYYLRLVKYRCCYTNTATSYCTWRYSIQFLLLRF